MGAAARANRARIAAGGVPKGRPDQKTDFSVRFINDLECSKAIKKTGVAHVRFPDREYLIGRDGVLRRLPPPAPAAVLEYGPSSQE